MKPTLETCFALAVAGLFAGACSKGGASADAASAETQTAQAGGNVKCLGINECKAQAQCGVPGGHSCAGQNECKGKGWLLVSESECSEKGGTVL